MLYINAEAVHSLCAKEADSSLVTVQFPPGLFDQLHPAPLLNWCARGRSQMPADRQVHRRLIVL